METQASFLLHIRQILSHQVQFSQYKTNFQSTRTNFKNATIKEVKTAWEDQFGYSLVTSEQPIAKDLSVIYYKEVLEKYILPIYMINGILQPSPFIERICHHASYFHKKFPELIFPYHEYLVKQCGFDFQKELDDTPLPKFIKDVSLVVNEPNHYWGKSGLDIVESGSQYLPNVSFSALVKQVKRNATFGLSTDAFGTPTKVDFARIWLGTAAEKINRFRIIPCLRFLKACLDALIAYHGAFACLNPVFFVYRKIYDHYGSWPFLELADKIIYLETSDVSVQLPIFSGCLIQLLCHAQCGNINHDEVKITINTYDLMACNSLDRSHLQLKKMFDPFLKLNYAHIDQVIPHFNSTSAEHDTVTLNHVIHMRVDEIGLPEARIAFEEIKKKNPQYIQFWTYIEKRLRILASQPLIARSHFAVTVSIMINPGNFIAAYTDTFLKESAEPKTEEGAEGLGIASDVFRWMGKEYPFKYKLTPHYEELFQIYKEHLDGYLSKKVLSVDLPAEYLDSLTAKSGADQISAERQPEIEEKIRHEIAKLGIDANDSRPIQNKYSASIPKKLMMKMNDSKKRDTRNLLSQRSIAKMIVSKRISEFALTEMFYYDPKHFQSILRADGVLGERSQNDRRVRVIYVIQNSVQIGTLMVKLIGEYASSAAPWYSSGKACGNIKDMSIQLFATSSDDVVSLCGDVAGADTSTNAPKYAFPMILAMHAFRKYPHSYFCFDPIVQNGVFISAPVQALAVCYYAMRVAVYTSKRSQLGISAKLSGETFGTGSLGTSATHALNYALMNQLAIESTPLRHFIRQRVQGDDIMLTLKFLGDNLNEKAQELSSQIVQKYKKFGYKLEPFDSRVLAIFLQQRAVAGTVLPLPARLSLYFAEKSQGKFRFPVSLYKEVQSVANEFAARSRLPSAMSPLKKALWNEIRIINMYDEKPIPDDETYYLSMKNKKGKNDLSFQIPMIAYGHPQLCNDSVIPPVKSVMHASSFWQIAGSLYYFTLYHHARHENTDFNDPLDYLSTLNDVMLCERIVSYRQEQLREDVVATPAIRMAMNELADRTRKYLYDRKFSRSNHGISKLSAAGIHIPRGLTVIGAQEKKMKDMILEAPESFAEQEWKAILFSRHLWQSRGMLIKKSNFALVQFNFHPEEIKQTIHRHGAVNNLCPISTVLSDDPSHKHLLSLFGLPLDFKAAYGYQTVIKGAPNIDIVLDFWKTIPNRKELQIAALDAMGIPETEYNKISSLATYGNFTSKWNFHHTHDSKKLFYLNTNRDFASSELQFNDISYSKRYAVDLWRQYITGYPQKAALVFTINSLGTEELVKAEVEKGSNKHRVNS